MSRRIRIAGACLNQIPLDWDHNLRNIRTAIREAKSNGIDLLCLPELCITGYGCEDVFLSEWLPEKSIKKLVDLLPATTGIAVIVGLPVRYEDTVYNCVATAENGELKGIYAKHNLAREGVHYEPRWFGSWPYDNVQTMNIAGTDIPFGALTYEFKGIKIGFEICEDAWQEDRPACYYREKGIELILNPSASHFAFGKETFRENLVRESSAQFDCVYLYTNLLGNEAGRMIYDGDIIICRKGQLIGHNRRFSFRDQNMLWLDVDFDSGENTTDVRKDHETDLEEFSNALPLALFDYCRKSRSKGFVISLSGGADSGTIAVLVAHMVRTGIAELGVIDFLEKMGITDSVEKENDIVKSILLTAYQGTKNSSKETLNAANTLANSLGATHYQWRIDDEVDGFTGKIELAIGRTLSWEKDDIALQNIQARVRSPGIWMLANVKRFLLLTTSNRSEGDMGYTTMDGDTSGSVAPIAGVDKVFIRKWLVYAEQELGYSGLKNINEIEPTAELRPPDKSQTDEDDLMPFPVLLAIERLAIRDRQSPVQVYEALKDKYNGDQLKGWIRKFYRLWSANQWKRERIALSFHVDDFNVDPRTWCRFPILSSSFQEELRELSAL